MQQIAGAMDEQPSQKSFSGKEDMRKNRNKYIVLAMLGIVHKNNHFFAQSLKLRQS